MKPKTLDDLRAMGKEMLDVERDHSKNFFFELTLKYKPIESYSIGIYWFGIIKRKNKYRIICVDDYGPQYDGPIEKEWIKIPVVDHKTISAARLAILKYLEKHN